MLLFLLQYDSVIFKKRTGLCSRNADTLEIIHIFWGFLFCKKKFGMDIFCVCAAVVLETIFGLKTDILIELKVFLNRHCRMLFSVFSRK